MDSCKLSGADYFMLAMEKHVQKQAGPGYVCRFAMTLSGTLSREKLQQHINASEHFQLLQRVYLHYPAVGPARWKLRRTPVVFPIFEQKQDKEEVPVEILERDIPLEAEALCEFDLIHIDSDKTILIFSWHHLLMDGFGANKLLESLKESYQEDQKNFFPKEEKEGLWNQWKQLVFTKDWLREISVDPLVKIKAAKNSFKTGYLISQLNEQEHQQVEKAMKQYSKGLVSTPYYLACAAKAYQSELGERYSKGDFFVPMPTETRKKGARGPVLTNQHSMLFFRMQRDQISNKATLVYSIGQQFFEQVRQRLPQQYAAMIRMLRLIPTWFYYRLIQRPNGDGIASFIFSQSPAPDNLQNFMGHQLLDATALPPNTAPPGISFQIMTFEGRLKLVLQYSENCFTKDQAQRMIKRYKQELLNAHE